MAKLSKVGLLEDPYCIARTCLSWSDVMMFMVSTPSPYTKESIRYFKYFDSQI